MSREYDDEVVVITAHRSNYPNPVTFNEGESFEVGRRDDEYPGWIWVITSDGNQGWAPIQYLKTSKGRAFALKDYNARELNVNTGDKLHLHHTLNGWVWASDKENSSGWIPLECLEI
ncbi:SH3 domain-containing protein [Spongorhabdus nitratireducens]